MTDLSAHLRLRRSLLLPALIALAILSSTSPSAQAKDRSYIQITGGSAARLPLASPAIKRGAADESGTEAATLIHQVMTRDLELSGYFELLDSKASIEPPGAGLQTGEFDFEHWRLPGAVGLVKAGLRSTEQGWSLELYVYDVDAGLQILARRIGGPEGSERMIAHRAANAVVEAFTGEPGIFDSRIVSVIDFGQGKEVYTYDFDTANLRPVSRNGSINLSPAFSPDGNLVTYTSYRDNNPDLWVTDLRSGRHTKISARQGINAGAEWSPDGSELALTLSKDQDSEIYTLAPDGAIMRRLTRSWGIDVSPTYSPDGSTIAFVSSRNGTPQIFLMNADGRNVRRLTQMGGHNVSPSFSPDGKRLAFAGRDEGRFDIFVINTDGTGLRRLTQSPADDEDPTWSPDGHHILFVSSRGGRAKQLFLMTSDGGSQTQLTSGKGSYSNPMWGPPSR